MKSYTAESVFFWILLGVAGWLAYEIIQPFLEVIFLAGVTAIVFAPVNDFFLKNFKQQRIISGLLTSFTVSVSIILPLLYFINILFRELLSVSQSYVQDGGVYMLVGNILSFLEKYLSAFIPDLSLSTASPISFEPLLSWLVLHIDVFLGSLIGICLNVLLYIVSLFMFSTESKNLRLLIAKWSPLGDDNDMRIISQFIGAINAVVKGSILSALLQGILVAIGFALFGVTQPALWGSVAFLSALIPPFGSALVTVPAALYMIFTGHIGAGIGLIVCGVIVGIVDNVIKPIIMKEGTGAHPFIVLLSIVGGLTYFGPFGFIIGPIIISVFFALLNIYPLLSGNERKYSKEVIQ